MATTHTLILDGFWGRPRRWETLRRAVEQSVGPATIYRYDCSGLCAFDALGSQLAQEIRRRADVSGGRVNVVGYSMGGVVIRSAHLLDASLPIARAVFMNAPHGGSWLACLLPLAGVRQMRPFDPHVQRLRDHRWDVPTLTIWNPIDGIIVPGRNTRWEGAGEHACCSVPIHYWPVVSKAIRSRVIDFLASGEAAEATETTTAAPATNAIDASRGSIGRGIDGVRASSCCHPTASESERRDGGVSGVVTALRAAVRQLSQSQSSIALHDRRALRLEN